MKHDIKCNVKKNYLYQIYFVVSYKMQPFFIHIVISCEEFGYIKSKEVGTGN